MYLSKAKSVIVRAWRCLIALSALLPAALHAQGLSLEAALEKATANNASLRAAQYGSQAAEADAKRANAAFLPVFRISENYATTTDPLQSFGILLKQETVEQEDFNPASLNDPDPITNFNTRFEAMQPVFNAEGLLQRQAARSAAEAARLKTRAQTAMTRFEVKRTYFALQLARQSLSVIEKALEAARANLALAQDNLAAGYLQEADVTAVRIRVLELENQLAEAESAAASEADRLRFLMGEPTGEGPLELSDTLAYREAERLDGPEAALNTSELQALRKGAEARDKAFDAQRARLLPSLNAFAAFEFNDETPFGTGADNWTVGASLSWTLFSGGERIAAQQKAKAEQLQTQTEIDGYEQQKRLQFAQAARQADLARQRYDISELAVGHAQESYRIRRDRFAEGLEKTSDLLMAEATLSGKRLERLQALYAYHVAIFQLQLLTESDR